MENYNDSLNVFVFFNLLCVALLARFTLDGLRLIQVHDQITADLTKSYFDRIPRWIGIFVIMINAASSDENFSKTDKVKTYFSLAFTTCMTLSFFCLVGLFVYEGLKTDSLGEILPVLPPLVLFILGLWYVVQYLMTFRKWSNYS
jgi:hypothetical protein